MCALEEAEQAKRVAEEATKEKYLAPKEAEQALEEMRKYRNCAEEAKAKFLESIKNINSDFRIQCITCGFTCETISSMKINTKAVY